MSYRNLSARTRRTALAVVAVGLATLLAPLAAAQAAPAPGKVKVMSRNLYLGADLTPALAAQTPAELAFATLGIWQSLEVTNFPKRAGQLAKEINGAKPDLVGLQEVALWRGDFEGAQDGPVTPATTVKYDFLELLVNKLNKKGKTYKVVRKQREADIEAPIAGGGTDPAGIPGDGRLTMNDVVLARVKSGVQVQDDFSQRFRKDHSLIIEDIGGTPLDITVWRGWIALDANVRGTEFRFVNTHLEAFNNDAKLAQAEELVAGIGEVVGGVQDEVGPANPGGVTRPVVLVGDLNSDDEIVETEGDTPQHQADELPYAHIVNAGLEERSYDGLNTDGLDDQFSCCFSDDLLQEDPATALEDIDHTVDHVMVSDDDHGEGVDNNGNDVELVKSFATGDDPAVWAINNLWPSDHLGVFSVLQFPTQ